MPGEIQKMIELCVLEARASATACKTQHGISEWTTRAWLESSGVSSVVAEAINQPIADEDARLQLHFVRALSASGDRSTVLELLKASNVIEALADCVWQELQRLNAAKAATGEELNNKFAHDAGFTMSYGGLDSFYGGLEALVGRPSVHVKEAMQADHCNKADSMEDFTTDNYGITTTSKVEWHFVVHPERGPKPAGKDAWPMEAKLSAPEQRHLCRRVRQQAELDEIRDMQINAQLEALNETPMTSEELFGGILYTGPMFVKYNAVMRGGALKVDQGAFTRQKFETICRGNRYATTIHVINSALLKLGKLQNVAVVYRGMSGGILPKQFWEPNKFGVRGGVEFGFLSTTMDRGVALSYAQGGVSTVFQIRMGMVDKGADLSVLSQYPHEKEICFAPLTGLEVLSTDVEASALIVHTRLDVNMANLTIDEVISKRKKVVCDMCTNLQLEAENDLALTWTTVSQQNAEFKDLKEQLMRRIPVLFKRIKDTGAADFNTDDAMKAHIEDAISISQCPRFLLCLAHSHYDPYSFSRIKHSLGLLKQDDDAAPLLTGKAQANMEAMEALHAEQEEREHALEMLENEFAAVRQGGIMRLAHACESGGCKDNEVMAAVAQRLLDVNGRTRALALDVLQMHCPKLPASLSAFSRLASRYSLIDRIFLSTNHLWMQWMALYCWTLELNDARTRNDYWSKYYGYLWIGYSIILAIFTVFVGRLKGSQADAAQGKLSRLSSSRVKLSRLHASLDIVLALLVACIPVVTWIVNVRYTSADSLASSSNFDTTFASYFTIWVWISCSCWSVWEFNGVKGRALSYIKACGCSMFTFLVALEAPIVEVGYCLVEAQYTAANRRSATNASLSMSMSPSPSPSPSPDEDDDDTYVAQFVRRQVWFCTHTWMIKILRFIYMPLSLAFIFLAFYGASGMILKAFAGNAEAEAAVQKQQVLCKEEPDEEASEPHDQMGAGLPQASDVPRPMEAWPARPE